MIFKTNKLLVNDIPTILYLKNNSTQKCSCSATLYQNTSHICQLTCIFNIIQLFLLVGKEISKITYLMI